MADGNWHINVWQLIVSGGPLMWPILLCSMFATTIIIEKLMFFRNVKIDSIKLKRQVFELVRTNKIKEAIVHCDSFDSPVAKIFKAGLTKFGCPRQEIKENIEDVSLYEIPKLEIRLNALATIAHIAPLLGLLGTVTGMVSIFHTIQVRSASLNPISPADLSGGIWQALITTVAGLMVAIASSIAYNYLVNRVHYIVLDMERAATDIVNFLSQVTEGN